MKKVLLVLFSIVVILSNPITANAGERSQFSNNVGVGIILNAQLSNEEIKEIEELAIQIIRANARARQRDALRNARERSAIATEVEDTTSSQSNRWGIELTDDEIDLLAKIVWLEAGNQGLEGQELVVVTIFNRIISDDFDDEVQDVLSASGQFSTWASRFEARPTDETYQAINDVLYGEVSEDIASRQYHFFNNAPNGGIQIGGHWFK